MLQVTLDFRLELPQVAVIGSQSSGKSSVLEALVGAHALALADDNNALYQRQALITGGQGLSAKGSRNMHQATPCASTCKVKHKRQ